MAIHTHIGRKAKKTKYARKQNAKQASATAVGITTTTTTSSGRNIIIAATTIAAACPHFTLIHGLLRTALKSTEKRKLPPGFFRFRFFSVPWRILIESWVRAKRTVFLLHLFGGFCVFCFEGSSLTAARFVFLLDPTFRELDLSNIATHRQVDGASNMGIDFFLSVIGFTYYKTSELIECLLDTHSLRCLIATIPIL